MITFHEKMPVPFSAPDHSGSLKAIMAVRTSVEELPVLQANRTPDANQPWHHNPDEWKRSAIIYLLAETRRFATVTGMKFIVPRALLVLLLAFSFSPVQLMRAGITNDDLAIADAELNESYQKALALMPNAESKTKLREAQRAWVAFRDAEIALHLSIPPVSSSQIKIRQAELTDARTKQLKDLAVGN